MKKITQNRKYVTYSSYVENKFKSGRGVDINAMLKIIKMHLYQAVFTE